MTKKYEMDYENYMIADEVLGLIRRASREPEKIKEIESLAMIKIELLESLTKLSTSKEIYKDLLLTKVSH